MIVVFSVNRKFLIFTQSKLCRNDFDTRGKGLNGRWLAWLARNQIRNIDASIYLVFHWAKKGQVPL